MERHILTELRYQYRPTCFHSENEVNLSATNVKELYQKMTEVIFEHINSYNKEGFYKFSKVLRLDIHLNEYFPLRGDSYIY